MSEARIGQLDGVRAVAIALVFVNHAFKVKLAWAGVDVFFVLSGFLITEVLLERTGLEGRGLRGYLADFYGRRARRILPPYVMLLAVTPIFFGFAWLRAGYMYVFLMNVALAFGMPHVSSLNVLWSLAVEEQFYLVWPLLVFVLSERALGWGAAGLVVLAPVLRYFCTPLFASSAAIYMLAPFRMDLLAVGGLVAIGWRWRRGWIERWGSYGPVLALGAGVALWWLARGADFNINANTAFANVWIYELTLLASLGVVLWALGGRYVGALRWGWVRYVGRISYGFYLIHTTVLLVLQRWLPGRWGVAGLTLGISLAYAAASWEWMERPLLYGRAGSGAGRDERAISGFG